MFVLYEEKYNKEDVIYVCKKTIFKRKVPIRIVDFHPVMKSKRMMLDWQSNSIFYFE
jgi:hypothetical protein